MKNRSLLHVMRFPLKDFEDRLQLNIPANSHHY